MKSLKRPDRLAANTLLYAMCCPAIFAGLFALPSTAVAQDTSDVTSDVMVLETITVEARKIEEPVQRIPFGITVIGSNEIERQRIQETRDFARITPGLNLTDVGVRSGNTVNIRGVGSFLPISSEDTSVPVLVDGVPVPLRAADQTSLDIERIEVLRGPQDTLFGRNAQAGAINITTADPTFEPVFELGGEVGNLSHGRVRALANGPLGNNLAGRTAFQFSTRDGDIQDLNLDDEARDQDLTNASGKLLWLPTEDTELSLALRYGNYDEEPVQGVFLEDPAFPRLFLDTKTRSDIETFGTSLTARHDLSFGTLTSVTGLQHYDARFEVDDTDGFVFGASTGSPPSTFNDRDADFRIDRDDSLQITQDLRLDGELKDGTQWLIGLSFFYSDLEFVQRANASFFFDGVFDKSFTTKSYASYGEVTVPVTGKTRLIGGLRFTRDEKELEEQFFDPSGSVAVFPSNQNGRNFNLFSGRVGVTYDFVPEVTGFATISRGEKSGGFQLVDNDVAFGFPSSDFDAATTWTYEAGGRGRFLDGLVEAGASIFFNDTANEQIPVFQLTPFQGVIENLDTQTYGAEVEAVVRPVEGLALSGGVALLQSEITSSKAQGVRVGNELPFAPSVAFNIAAEYERMLQVFGWDGMAFGRVGYQYVGSRTVDPQNTFDLPAFDLVNLSVGWNSDSFSVYGFGKNVFDESYAETAFFVGNAPNGGRVSFGIPGLPRQFGIGAKLRF